MNMLQAESLSRAASLAKNALTQGRSVAVVSVGDKFASYPSLFQMVITG